jgi:hypothetical protein
LNAASADFASLTASSNNLGPDASSPFVRSVISPWFCSGFAGSKRAGWFFTTMFLAMRREVRKE